MFLMVIGKRSGLDAPRMWCLDRSIPDCDSYGDVTI